MVGDGPDVKDEIARGKNARDVARRLHHRLATPLSEEELLGLARRLLCPTSDALGSGTRPCGAGAVQGHAPMRRLIAELPPVSVFQVTHEGVVYDATWVEGHASWPRAFEARPRDAGRAGLLCGVVLFRPRVDGRYWPYGITRGVEAAMLDYLHGRELGWVPTPEAVAETLATLAEIRPGHRLLDPSAGHGALTQAALLRGASVCAVEIDHDRAMHLRATNPHVEVYERDFLTLAPSAFRAPFERVLMSPPFRLVGLPFADLAHVAHAARFVAPGGRLVAVMHARLLDEHAPVPVRAFRARLQARGAHFTPMAEGVFRAKGGDANTVVVVLKAPDHTTIPLIPV